VTGVVGRGVAGKRLVDADAGGRVPVPGVGLSAGVRLDELAADAVGDGAPFPAAEQAPSGSRKTATSSAGERMTHCGR
jgi:hypothetical protein